ncbi:MAG: SGNH/GDSL hydrolase family protein [Candidatus Eremiobacteraeota bacterium]|nr:SGNH/GDSL hydrolase family protein [Candidatus Eremiobacteraeota bacterium]
MLGLKKHVHVVEPGLDWGIFQSMYVDRKTNWLIPNVCLIEPDGKILFQTNALRLKGPDVEPGTNIAIVWGDSQVFGAGTTGWPELMNEFSPSCVFLNGGIEGVDYVAVLQRVVEFNRQHPVAVNVVLPGWHTVGKNKNFASDLANVVEEVPNVVLATMPTSLTPSLASTDLAPYLTGFGESPTVASLDEGFGFWGVEPYSIELAQRIYAHLLERNAAIRVVAGEQRVPLLDLFAAFDSRGVQDFRRDFFDIAHPRPRAYREFAAVVYAELAPTVEALSSASA